MIFYQQIIEATENEIKEKNNKFKFYRIKFKNWDKSSNFSKISLLRYNRVKKLFVLIISFIIFIYLYLLF